MSLATDIQALQNFININIIPNNVRSINGGQINTILTGILNIILGITLSELTLNVTTDNQTTFNISTLPVTSTLLNINGIIYLQDIDYSIGQVGANVILTWFNSFPLSASDTVVLLKF